MAAKLKDYVCSVCGAGAYYDGRGGDGPVLVCGCDTRGGYFIPDRCGGYLTNPSGTRPVPPAPVRDPWENYANRLRAGGATSGGAW